MREKNMIIISVLSVLLVLVSGYSIYLNQQTISKDEVKEREEILIAVMKIIDMPDEEIEEILVTKTEVASYPNMYIVVINKYNGAQIVYQWADEDKSKVIGGSL